MRYLYAALDKQDHDTVASFFTEASSVVVGGPNKSMDAPATGAASAAIKNLPVRRYAVEEYATQALCSCLR